MAKKFSKKPFLDRLKSVVYLANRPDTIETEKSAARAGVERMRESANEHASAMDKVEADAFLADVKVIIEGRIEPPQATRYNTPPPASKYRPPPPPPKYKRKDVVYCAANNLVGNVLICGERSCQVAFFLNNGGISTQYVYVGNLRFATGKEIDDSLAKHHLQEEWQILRLAHRDNRIVGVAKDRHGWMNFWGEKTGQCFIKKWPLQHLAYDVVEVLLEQGFVEMFAEMRDVNFQTIMINKLKNASYIR